MGEHVATLTWVCDWFLGWATKGSTWDFKNMKAFKLRLVEQKAWNLEGVQMRAN
jgi:hypothetical protein